ncbi:MAG: tyrosine-protein phosphatase [Deltaproteobacteria bacterium]|nr:tyrosine-protein phosphatase [Deltaproteobacteria bacterium]
MKKIFLILFLLGKTSLYAEPVKNFGVVTPFVYRGARVDSEDDFKFLNEQGIYTIINLRTKLHPDDNELCEKYNMKCAIFPILLLWRTDKNFDYKMLQKAFAYLIKKTNKEEKVYIHCHYGSDRTGALSAAVTIRENACFQEEYDAEALSKKITTDLKNHGFHRSAFPILYKTIQSWAFEIPQWVCDDYK